MAGDEVLIQPDILLGGRAVRYGAPQLATEAQAFPGNVEAPLLGVLVAMDVPEVPGQRGIFAATFRASLLLLGEGTTCQCKSVKSI